MKRPLFPLIRKELTTSLNNAFAYMVAVIFLVFSSLWFLNINNFAANDYASFRKFFGIFPILYVFLIPVLTMRVWAEEQRSGTVELLLTMPYTARQLVLGKFIANLLYFSALMLLTLPMVFILSFTGDFSPGVIFSEYLGVLLLGALGISIGLFFSSISSNQIAAALLTLVVLLFFIAGLDALSYNSTFPAWLSGLIHFLSLNFHYDSFAKGVVDSRDLLFFVVATALFLYLNSMVLIFRKWS